MMLKLEVSRNSVSSVVHKTGRPNADRSFLPENGQIAELIKSVDWSRSPIGPVSTWPVSLRAALGLILGSRQPMLIWWGPELIQFFNDAYLETAGSRLVSAMGQPASQCWSDVWPMIEVQVANILAGSEASWEDDRLIPQWRDGLVQDLYWSYGMSSVLSESGDVVAILVVATETTDRVVRMRHQMALQCMSDSLLHCPSDNEIPGCAQKAIERLQWQQPQPLFYKGLAGSAIRPWVSNARGDALKHCHIAEWFGRQPELLEALRLGEPIFFRYPLASDDAHEASWDGQCFAVPVAEFGSSEVDRFVLFRLPVRRVFDETQRAFYLDATDRVAQSHFALQAQESRVRAMEDRDNQLLQAPIATAIVVGPNLVFSLVNPMYEHVAGRRIQTGKTFEESFPELVGTPMPRLFKSVYVSGQPYVSEETRLMLDRDGSGALEECYFQYNLQPMRSTDGEVYGLMIVAVDLTHRVLSQLQASEDHARSQALLTERGEHLERLVSERTRDLQAVNGALTAANHELEFSRDAAHAASRAKSAFVANMSHEIRTPLNGILGLAHLLARDVRNEQQAQLLARMKDAGQHLLQIVNDILDLSKIEAGKLTPEETDFSLDDLMSTSIAMVDDRARAKGLRLVIRPHELPRMMRGDPTRLSQVLLNLLSNAVKFTCTGSISVESQLVRENDNELVVCFSVQDTGEGIANERHEGIFNAFEQGDNSTTRRYGGTGLGLSLTRKLARAMGGDVGLVSELGTGSTFWATARLRRATGAGFAAAPVPTISLRALIVDNAGHSLEKFGKLLFDMGMRVDGASSASQALATAEVELLDGRPYDLILVDAQMAVLDGKCPIEDMRQHLGQGMPPTVLIVEEVSQRLRDDACRQSFDAVVSKSATASALRDCVFQLLRRQSGNWAKRRDDENASVQLLKRRHHGQRVLVAEDNEVNLLVAQELLAAVGLVVEPAKDGVIALELVLSRSYDLVLMDMQMPFVDGLQATRTIRSKCGHAIPIIAMTANAFVEDRNACLDAGMNDHVAKPIDPAVLYSTLLRWLPLRK